MSHLKYVHLQYALNQYSKWAYYTHLRPHVLGGVNSNAGHADVHQLVEVTGNGVADVIQRSVQIRQTDEVAVAHVIRISVVVDVACVNTSERIT